MARRNSKGLRILAGCAMFAACGCVSAGDPAAPASTAFDNLVNSARTILQDGSSRLEAMFAGRFRSLDQDKPDWLREQSSRTVVDEGHGADSLQLVLQQDRRDGPDLLTLRYPLAETGTFRSYAGAGLNQTEYFADADGDSAPTMLSRRVRHRSLGAAAELGAELRLSEQLRLNADLRWIDLDPQANLLRAEDGLVGADPLAVGLSLGWRFR